MPQRERAIIISTRNDLNITPTFPAHEPHIKTVKDVLKTVTPNLIKKLNHQTEYYAHKCKPGKNLGTVHPKGNYFNHIYVNIDKPAPTITKSFSLFVKYKNTFRYLAPNELAKIQSFPDNYKWIGSPNDVVGRIGNSVPPMMMKAIAEHIYNNVLKNKY